MAACERRERFEKTGCVRHNHDAHGLLTPLWGEMSHRTFGPSRPRALRVKLSWLYASWRLGAGRSSTRRRGIWLLVLRRIRVRRSRLHRRIKRVGQAGLLLRVHHRLLGDRRAASGGERDDDRVRLRHGARWLLTRVINSSRSKYLSLP